MVTYQKVAKRHAVYATGVLAVTMLAEFTWALTVVLFTLLALVRWHMNTPITFTMLSCLCGPLSTTLSVNLSAHTLWFAHGMHILAIPPWLLAVHGLFAHWALDAYWLVTLRDVRKTTLP